MAGMSQYPHNKSRITDFKSELLSKNQPFILILWQAVSIVILSKNKKTGVKHVQPKQQ
jgi:hypothetical protein